MKANEPQKLKIEAQIQSEIDLWGEKIRELRAKADQSSDPNVKTSTFDKIKEAQVEQEEARKRLKELKNAQGDVWHALKKEIDGLFSGLDESYREALAYFD